ncbi:MAG: hypothetical protein KC621_21115 [Myxococcales bacterium]|nr:hypothetical protein [Myxococcales bacterium]
MLFFAGSMAATPQLACVEGDAAACDEVRTRSASRWARGIVGYGPQEPWRIDEVHVLRVGPSYVACRHGDRAACERFVPAEVVRCLLDGICEDEGAPAPTPVAPRSVEDLPDVDPGDEPPIPEDPSVWVPLVFGAEGKTTIVEHRDGCGRVIVRPDGRPAAGVRVFGYRVQQTDERGVVDDCAPTLVAVDGTLAGVARQDRIEALRKRPPWRIQLEEGLRGRCRVNGGPAQWCDEVPLPASPTVTTRYVGRGEDGVFELARVDEQWRTVPESPWVHHTADDAPDRGTSGLGPMCVTDGRWRPCTGDLRLKVRDVDGQPTLLAFREGVGELDGVLRVPRGTEELRSLELARVRWAGGHRVTVLPTRPATDPRPPPDPEVWSALDWDARVRAVLDEIGLRREAVAYQSFVGGAYVGGDDYHYVGRDRDGTVAFADADTAVVEGPLVDGGPVVVHLGSAP